MILCTKTLLPSQNGYKNHRLFGNLLHKVNTCHQCCNVFTFNNVNFHTLVHETQVVDGQRLDDPSEVTERTDKRKDLQLICGSNIPVANSLTKSRHRVDKFEGRRTLYFTVH